MAPNNAAKTEKERKIKALLSFADALPARITSPHPDPTLSADLLSHIHTTFDCVNAPPAVSFATARQADLDAKGTALWNLSTRLPRQRGVDAGVEGKGVLCLLRVFAFLVLDVAAQQSRQKQQKQQQQQGSRGAAAAAAAASAGGSAGHGSSRGSGGGSFANCVRLLRVALKAGKVCMEGKVFDVCGKVLERAAWYWERCAEMRDEVTEEEERVGRRLGGEYWGLRVGFAWQQNRLDLAEHMFSKIPRQGQGETPLDASSAEELADLLFEIGKDQLTKSQSEMAAKWLERSLDVLDEQELEHLSPDAGELRLIIMQKLARALMDQQREDARARAWGLVKLMEVSYGEKMVVGLLKLELLASEVVKDVGAYYDVLLRIVRSAMLTQNNFKTIMWHVRKLKEWSPEIACRALDDLLTIRLAASDKEEWIESAVVTRMWIATTTPKADNPAPSIQETLDLLWQSTEKTLSPIATHAAQTLLWKRVEASYSQSDFHMAESWLRLASHCLLASCGELNSAKISRKFILCALGRQDYTVARKHYFKMSETAKAAPITRYLMYKVALRSTDVELAADCLEGICKQSSKDATLLYACALEAQQVGDRAQAVAALQKVLEKYDYGAPQGVHLPALLRCTARLLISELTPARGADEAVTGEICRLFEGALAQAKKMVSKRSTTALANAGPDAATKAAVTTTTHDWNTQELDWFSKNAYNLSLHHLADMHPLHLARLLESCTGFIDLLLLRHRPGTTDPSHLPSSTKAYNANTTVDTNSNPEQESLHLRRTFCHFLASCVHVTLARADDVLESSLQSYLAVRKHSRTFRDALPAQLASTSLDVSAKEDLVRKGGVVLRFEVEAGLRLEAWDDVLMLFDEALEQKHGAEGRWDELADLVLLVHSAALKKRKDAVYLAKVLAALQEIVNASLRGKEHDLVKVTRWLRCLFQLSASSGDDGATMACLDQAISLARESKVRTSASTTMTATTRSRLGQSTQVEQTYPSEELEWLATTSFNKAVDLYCVNDDERCRLWAEKALMLAGCAEGDAGGLERMLREKVSGIEVG
ncbi:hypothetical protein LTS18_006048 [Coniosporium uncinatum]|uniref:Uncharacterized protein n=1 Tax=Coniosporium uncinatum TaxID=93489 RepID=A0ACC3DAS1_9PEZI|nr:hypothetical protein LTS18_006048 [Coniosporium uncinatum]